MLRVVCYFLTCFYLATPLAGASQSWTTIKQVSMSKDEIEACRNKATDFAERVIVLINDGHYSDVRKALGQGLEKNEPQALYLMGVLLNHESYTLNVDGDNDVEAKKQSILREQAIDYLTRAANLNYVHAHFDLAGFYQFDENQQSTYLHHLRLSSESRDPRGMFALGKLKTNDPKTRAEGIELMHEAAQLSASVARELAFFYLATLKSGFADLNKDDEEYRENLFLAVKFAQSSARRCHASAAKVLADMFFYRLPERYQDKQTGFAWLEIAAELGDANAAGEAGGYYMSMTYGRERDYQKARYFCEKGAAGGHTDSMIYLGQIYNEGLGVKANNKLALKYYHMALKNDETNGHAAAMLGVIYFEDDHGLRNYSKAYRYCKQGAEKGYNYCQYLLGKMYYEGIGVDKNIEQALLWMRRSADAVMPQAKEWLKAHNY